MDEIEERRNKVKKLYLQGLNKNQIAKQIGVAYMTISRDVEYLKEQKQIEEKINPNYLSKIEQNIDNLDTKKMRQEFMGRGNQKIILDTYIAHLKEKLKQGTLKKEELDKIKDVIQMTEKDEHILFYIKACIKFGKIKEASKYVNMQIQSEKVSDESKEKLKQMKEKLDFIKKKHIAIVALKDNNDVKQAMKYSELPETVVIQLKQDLIKRNKIIKKTQKQNDEWMKR